MEISKDLHQPNTHSIKEKNTFEIAGHVMAF
jgi:hypothetical protein